jgi:hypothetical protein
MAETLVLALVICHVPHRTALLSQLVTRDARGQPPMDKGASSGGGEKAATGRTRHEGCLQD